MGPVRLHGLRHGFATLMLPAGAPIEVVSQMMGHASMSQLTPGWAMADEHALFGDNEGDGLHWAHDLLQVGAMGHDPGATKRWFRDLTPLVCNDELMERLGWRTLWHKHPGVRSGDQLTLGERAADRMRNMMGSWPFVFSFFAIMIAWAVGNTFVLQRVIHHKAFDAYPYILLNLFLSMLAGVQAAALLIAAKRADAISSEIAIHTEKNTDELKGLLSENTALTQLVKKNTDLLDDIHRHVSAMSRLSGGFGPGEHPPSPS
jgi:uncharacterized membrane protein